jgi:hypothetical protein
MGPKNTKKLPDLEVQIQKALYALKNKDFPSIRAAARFFEVDFSTLARRRRGGVSQSKGHEMAQILTDAEEKTLVRWIKRCSKGGFHIPTAMLLELALHIRRARVTNASSDTPLKSPTGRINRKWLIRFQKRHPEIGGIYAQQLEYARHEGASFANVRRWFNAVEAMLEEHSYEPQDIWNMDESGFGIGQEQVFKVLVYLDNTQKHRVVGGKQEWVTDIECINAAGEALPPLIIFKGAAMDSRWLNEQSPEGWHFATSKNGWTSNNLGLAWLKQVFVRHTGGVASERRRLLIADGHGSHIRADFIAYCMEHNIDLLIMPPHCSHILQPLDVGVFSAFKRYHAVETHALSRLSSQRIPRSEWVELLLKARERALSKENILSGWRSSGLWPAAPMRVLRNLPPESPKPIAPAATPHTTTNLDLSLLLSSPPEAIELSRSNKRFSESLRECPDVVSPVRRYADRMVRMCETQNATIHLMAKQLAEKDELLKKRKKAKKGKRVRLEGVSIYTTADILRIAREEEAATEARRRTKRRRVEKTPELSTEEEDDDSDDLFELILDESAQRRRGAVLSHVMV